MGINFDPNYLPECQPKYFTTLKDVADQMKNDRYAAIYKESTGKGKADEDVDAEGFSFLNERLHQIYSAKGKDFCFAWDMTGLVERPAEVLQSWQKAYHKFISEKYVSDTAQNAFLESTLFLLCCLQPNDRDRGVNPWKDHLLLQESFEQIQEAAWLYWQLYPHLASQGNNDLWGEKEYSSKECYSYKDNFVYKCSAYQNAAHLLMDGAKNLFKEYLKGNNVNLKILDNDDVVYALDLLEELLSKDAYVCFFFPFICTKVVLLLSVYKPDDTDAEGFSDKLFNFETYERTFESHNRIKNKQEDGKEDSISAGIENIAAFVNGVIGHMRPYERLLLQEKQKKNRFTGVSSSLIDIEAKVDCNWLALYLYGNGRYFDSNDFPFQYSRLTLPKLISHLFENDNGDFDLDFDWFFPGYSERNDSLTKKLRKELDKYPLDDNLIRARDEVGLLVDPFDDMFWVDRRFVPQRKSQEQAAVYVNQSIKEYEEILKENKRTPADAMYIFRLYCVEKFLSPIEHDLKNVIYSLGSIQYICSFVYSVYFDDKSKQEEQND